MGICIVFMPTIGELELEAYDADEVTEIYIDNDVCLKKDNKLYSISEPSHVVAENIKRVEFGATLDTSQVIGMALTMDGVVYDIDRNLNLSRSTYSNVKDINGWMILSEDGSLRLWSSREKN